jgi:hypothetical protein
MTTFWGIFAYGTTSIWILFNWFYLRPKQIKKQQSKLDEIIGKFEMLNDRVADINTAINHLEKLVLMANLMK